MGDAGATLADARQASLTDAHQNLVDQQQTIVPSVFLKDN
jgi:hypothetical protein